MSKFKVPVNGMVFSGGPLLSKVTKITESDLSADVVKLVLGSTSTVGEKQLKGNFVLVSSLITGTPQLHLPPEFDEEIAAEIVIQLSGACLKSLYVLDNSGTHGICIVDPGEMVAVRCLDGVWFAGATPPAADQEDGYASPYTPS